MRQHDRQPAAFRDAVRVFRRHGGTMRTGEAIEAGVHSRTLYAMRDAGVLQKLSRGVYRLSELEPLGNPDLTTVALRVPDGVVCLLSALAFHDMTTQVPHAVHLAIERGSERPRIEHPPVDLFWFGGEAYSEGIETHELDGVPVRIYCPEKTLADCFKYRNKLGVDTAVEALKLYAERGNTDVSAIMRYARICRVQNVMRPYLEAGL
ncbi:MAG: type IV toxin-antitoxin system AbiEi family antitoxin domain-containing protein [Candidatus Brocadiia bacterium]